MGTRNGKALRGVMMTRGKRYDEEERKGARGEMRRHRRFRGRRKRRCKEVEDKM